MILYTIVFVVGTLAYHELAHAIASGRLGVFENLQFIRYDHDLLQFLVWGPAVGIDEAATQRQLWLTALAPLVYLLPAVGFAVISYSGVVNLWLPVGVMVAAAGMTLLSDVPMLLCGVENDDNWRVTVLMEADSA